jgi:hypothetical protein
MRNRQGLIVAVAVSFITVCLVATNVRSQDKPADKKQPSMEEMMAAWAKYGSPGKEHEILKTLEGKFDGDVEMSMPGSPPEKSKGVSTNKLMFGGRYLHQEWTGTFMGKPFNGAGLWAFDKVKEKYISLWIDDMSTMVMTSEGTADSSGKVITVTSKCYDPISKEDKMMRSVLTVTDNDHHTYEAYQQESGGSETKCLTIKYTRAK